MPEPEFFIVLFAAGLVFVVCSLIAVGLFVWARRKNSKALKIVAAVPLICGIVVFAPMLFLLLTWIWYWIFGNKTAGSLKPQNPPPAATNYIR
jgi:hypothetical protein